MRLANASRTIMTVFAALSATTVLAAAHDSTKGAIPEEHRAGEVAYVSGGIGHEEALAMQHAAKGYPLELVFVQKVGKRNEYLAEMPVEITDVHHKVIFKGMSDGPYFLARLPEGRYVVSTHWGQWSFSRHVTVGKQTERVVFEWSKTAVRNSA